MATYGSILLTYAVFLCIIYTSYWMGSRPISLDIGRVYQCSSSSKEWCCPRDHSIAVVLITFFQPHQKKMILLRAVEHHSSTL